MYIFISDFFIEDGILGGGELNNDEFIKIVEQKGEKVTKIKSSLVTLSFLKKNKGSKYIVSNFVTLPKPCLDYLLNHEKYVIYEHDHKYLPNRDPSIFKDYTAPKNLIINYEFYKQAVATFCQSSLHKEVVEKNLDLTNVHNLSGNLWSKKTLELITNLNLGKQKTELYSIMHSQNPTKNADNCIKYCFFKKIPYVLIPHMKYHDFLSELSKHKGLIFFPNVIETLNRVCVEARMLNCEVVTNKKVGATSEEWFSLKGDKLIKEVYKMRDRIPEQILGAFNE